MKTLAAGKNAFAGATAAGSAGVGGLLGGALSFLGGPVGILAGVASIFGGRSRRKEEARNRAHQLQLQREGIEQAAAEQRRSTAYEAMLQDYYNQLNRSRRQSGFQNYVQGQRSGALAAPTNRPALQRMLNYNSPNRIQAPGAAPDPNAPIPSALNPTGGSGGAYDPLSQYANFVQR